MAYFSPNKPRHLAFAALLFTACSGDDSGETGFSGSSPTNPGSGFTSTTTTTAAETDDTATDTSTTTAATGTTDATDTDSCPLGQQGCACDDGACDPGLTCQAELCLPAAPACGDGNVDPGEECDDGEDNADTNACTAACALATCGDGLIHEGVELCDDANYSQPSPAVRPRSPASSLLGSDRRSAGVLAPPCVTLAAPRVRATREMARSRQRFGNAPGRGTLLATEHTRLRAQRSCS
jgi:hypothetical protein